jgi:hypothetical protein
MNRIKELSKTIRESFESIVDRADKLVNLGANVGVAYIGYRALKHPTGALVGLLALRLAESNNLAGGAAGVAALTGLGALNLIPPTTGPFLGDPGHRDVHTVLQMLQERGLWKPSTPISETPELMTKIRIGHDIYLEP